MIRRNLATSSSGNTIDPKVGATGSYEEFVAICKVHVVILIYASFDLLVAEVILRLFSISVTDNKRTHRQTIEEDNAGKHRGFILSAALPNT